jgi:hypothetical protein
MNSTTKIIREVNNQAELFYSEAVGLGDHAADALGKARRSQMTSLENIAESTMKSTDVFDFIKKQIARHDDWRKSFKDHKDANQGFGERLKTYLEKELPPKTAIISESVGIGNVTDKDQQQRRKIYLLLIRQFIRQVVVQYEYRLNPDKANQKRES